MKKDKKIMERFKITMSIIEGFIVNRNKKSLKDLRGKIRFSDDYDYKLMRN
jgi:hypothetical protein